MHQMLNRKKESYFCGFFAIALTQSKPRWRVARVKADSIVRNGAITAAVRILLATGIMKVRYEYWENWIELVSSTVANSSRIWWPSPKNTKQVETQSLTAHLRVCVMISQQDLPLNHPPPLPSHTVSRKLMLHATTTYSPVRFSCSLRRVAVVSTLFIGSYLLSVSSLSLDFRLGSRCLTKSRHLSTHSNNPKNSNHSIVNRDMSVNKRSFTKKGVKYDAETGEIVSCLFCKIHAREEPGRIVYEDEKYVVFHTIHPVTHLHLLVTPREHIANMRALEVHPERTKIMEEMMDIGRHTLGSHGDTGRFCFHIPPMNSIDHLHLHAIASPETMSTIDSMKYPGDTVFGFCKSAATVLAEFRRDDDSADKSKKVTEMWNKHKYSIP